MIRKAIWLVLLVAVPSFAQQGDWTPPPVPPPPPEEKPNPQPLPVSPPAQPAPSTATPASSAPAAAAPSQSATSPTGAAPAAPSAPQAAAASGTAAETKVTVIPGSEKHSPATMNFAIDDRKNLRVTASEIGGAGMWHMMSADLGRVGLFHLAVGGEFMALSNFPVLNASNTRTAGDFAISYVPIEHLEAYLSYGATANSNSSSSPSLMQAQGDLNLGLVGSYRVVNGLDLGLDLRGMFFPGIGSQNLGQYAAGFAPRILATFDVRDYAAQIPLRLHLNFGFIFDNTGHLTSQLLSPAEEFALGVNQYNRIALDLGVEAPLPYATIGVEYGFAFPLGSESIGACQGNYTGPDGVCVSAGQAMNHYIDIIFKVTAFQDITPTLGMQFGLAQRVARGIPATQPFNLVFGVSYNLDPFAKGESKLIEKTGEKVVMAPPPTTGKVNGLVIDSETKKPIGGALVTMDSGTLPPVATDATAGKFMSYELPPGKIAVAVVKDGYKPVSTDATVEVGKTANLEIALVRDVRKAVVTLKASSDKKPVVARFTFAGPSTVMGVTDAAGNGTVDVPVGHIHVAVNAEGYLAKAREIDAAEGGQVTLDVELAPIPKKPLVEIVENKIQVKQQVHFNTNKASILADSFPLLDQVIDAIVRSNLKKVRIEGNTDNQGGKQRNLKLSQDRASSVRDYFVKNGVDPSRLEAAGNGDTKPVAPNMTARGRELNRRVDFVIVDR